MKEKNPSVLKYTRKQKKKKPKTLIEQFKQMCYVIIAIVILLGIISIAVNADQRITLDGDAEITYTFRNDTDNKTYLDLTIILDIENSIDEVTLTLEDIEIKNTTETKELDFKLEINLNEVTEILIFNKVNNIESAIQNITNKTCDGINCIEAYNTCVTQKNLSQLRFEICDSNLVNKTKEHNTTATALGKEKSKSASLRERIAKITPEEETTNNLASGNLIELISQNIILIIAAWLIIAYNKKWFPFKPKKDSNDPAATKLTRNTGTKKIKKDEIIQLK